jgi:hypothetical protein
MMRALQLLSDRYIKKKHFCDSLTHLAAIASLCAFGSAVYYCADVYVIILVCISLCAKVRNLTRLKKICYPDQMRFHSSCFKKTAHHPCATHARIQRKSSLDPRAKIAIIGMLIQAHARTQCIMFLESVSKRQASRIRTCMGTDKCVNHAIYCITHTHVCVCVHTYVTIHLISSVERVSCNYF